ncbi:hypothetical protein AB0J52_00295 [Spirillospora sp. NPDC049652]
MTNPMHKTIAASGPGGVPAASPTAGGQLVPMTATWSEALDVAELQADELRRRRVRQGIGAAFFAVGAAITASALVAPHPALHLPSVTVPAVPAALVAIAAVASLARLLRDLASRFTAFYQVTRSGRRWQVERRWYAPGSYARLRHEPREFVAVLGWAHDPACAEPWVLIQQDGRGARFVPLHHIQPLSAPGR